jgi:hypothetical protein
MGGDASPPPQCSCFCCRGGGRSLYTSAFCFFFVFFGMTEERGRQPISRFRTELKGAEAGF